MWVAPTNIAATNVNIFRPGAAPPARPTKRTVASTNDANPNRSISVAAANRPASATNDSSSKTTPNPSILRDTPLTGSASRIWAVAAITYGHSPRSARHFRAFTPPNAHPHRWIQA